MSKKTTQGNRRLIRKMQIAAVTEGNAYEREEVAHQARLFLLRSEVSQAEGRNQREARRLLESL